LVSEVAIRTPDQRLRVFVSSALEELADERRAVSRAISALRLALVMFELGARPYPPQEVYRAYLAQSDVRSDFALTQDHAAAVAEICRWGPERTRRVIPVGQWLAAGASLAAGTGIGWLFNPMTGVWGMVTRGTKSAGIQGPEPGIDAVTPMRLHTMGAAALNHEQDRLGSIVPGKLAGLAGYLGDPLAADPDDLAELTPAFTSAGGRVTHDADKRPTR
jgi:predicted amidohydrolase YtcJ